MKFKFKIKDAYIIAFAMGFSVATHAANVEFDTFQRLLQEADTQGTVPIAIHLLNSTFTDLQKNRGLDVREKAAHLQNLLLNELGSEALKETIWSNQIGQMEVHVTPIGLARLRESRNAQSFTTGRTWYAKTHLRAYDGAHEAVEQALRSENAVNLEVLLNVDGLNIETSADGKYTFKGEYLSIQNASEALISLLNQEMEEKSILNKNEVLNELTNLKNTGQIIPLTIKVNRKGLLLLVNSLAVRSVRPLNYVDPRLAIIDRKIHMVADRDGEVDVLLSIRIPYHSYGLSNNSRERTIKDYGITINSLLKDAKDAKDAKILQDLSEFGAISVRLTKRDLEALEHSLDRRLLSVTESNNIVAEPALATSVPLVNVPPVWNAGFSGTGQGIIVMDTGIQHDHVWLNGRVISLACFGTSGVLSDGTNVQSFCPQASAATNWDSPPNTTNPASPLLGGPANQPRSIHGTHVAGIAGSANSIFKGVAPSATIYSIQMASRNISISGQKAIFVEIDSLTALQNLVNALPALPAPNQQSFTVNLSVGDDMIHGFPCASSATGVGAQQAFRVAFDSLKNAGIPVIAVTGNTSARAGIVWPGCTPGVIKVGSVNNDGVGNTLTPISASVRRINYPGETFWLAPGGDITSSVPGITNVSFALTGTSMAAPHISGVYALAKSIDSTVSVDGWNAWLTQNASISVPITVAPFVNGPTLTENWPRLRLPY